MITYISLSRYHHGYAEFFASADERGISLIYFTNASKPEYIDQLQNLAKYTGKEAVYIKVSTRAEFRKKVKEMGEKYNTDNILKSNEFDTILNKGEYNV